MTLGILCATRFELPDFLLYRKSSIPYLDEKNNVIISISGMGADNTIHAAEQLAQQSLDHLLCIGFCGGISAKVGNVVIAEQVRYDNDQVQLDLPSYMDKNWKPGVIHTFNHIVLNQKKVEEDDMAVDREAYFAADQALRHGLPITVIKAVSDEVPSHSYIHSLPLVGRLMVLASVVKNYKTAKASIGHAASVFLAQYKS